MKRINYDWNDINNILAGMHTVPERGKMTQIILETEEEVSDYLLRIRKRLSDSYSSVNNGESIPQDLLEYIENFDIKNRYLYSESGEKLFSVDATLYDELYKQD